MAPEGSIAMGLLPVTCFDVICDLAQDISDTDAALRASIRDGAPSALSRGNAVRWPEGLTDHDRLAKAAHELMRKRAKADMLNACGQLFAKSPQDIV